MGDKEKEEKEAEKDSGDEPEDDKDTDDDADKLGDEARKDAAKELPKPADEDADSDDASGLVVTGTIDDSDNGDEGVGEAGEDGVSRKRQDDELSATDDLSADSLSPVDKAEMDAKDKAMR